MCILITGYHSFRSGTCFSKTRGNARSKEKDKSNIRCRVYSGSSIKIVISLVVRLGLWKLLGFDDALDSIKIAPYGCPLCRQIILGYPDTGSILSPYYRTMTLTPLVSSPGCGTKNSLAISTASFPVPNSSKSTLRNTVANPV